MFDRMVRGWRDVWGIGDFPFYYCQLAPYNYADNFGNGSYHSAYFREAQAKGMLTPNTGMAVLMDAESPDDIHPTKKKDAGERLALWALAKDFGLEKLRCRSLEYKTMTVEGRVAVLMFDMFSPDGQSFLTSYGKDIRHFTIADKDERFFPAVATIDRNMIYVFAPQVKEPVAVRYCWDDTSGAEIFSMDGHLPVSSFRTDMWE
jgi:sialate O-acetylesterase